MAFKTFEQFIAEKVEPQPPTTTNKMELGGNTDTPAQGKNANSYMGPNFKNNPKSIRVADGGAGNKTPLGDEATPTFSNRKEVMPMGEKPETDLVKVEHTLKKKK